LSWKALHICCLVEVTKSSFQAKEQLRIKRVKVVGRWTLDSISIPMNFFLALVQACTSLYKQRKFESRKLNQPGPNFDKLFVGFQ
jgi:hypothetical protein